MAILLIGFLRKLPSETAFYLRLSGSIFVSGAIGFEMLGGKIVSENGKGTLIYVMFYTLEEFMELLGVVLFIFTLLRYMSFLHSENESKLEINLA